MELKYDNTGNYGNQCIGKDKTKADRAALADSILGKDNYNQVWLGCRRKDNQLMHASGVDRAVYEAYTSMLPWLKSIIAIRFMSKMTLRLLHRIMLSADARTGNH